MTRPLSRRRAALAVALPVLLALPLSGAQEEPEVRVVVDNPRPAADDVIRLTYAFSGPGVGGSSLRAPAQLPLKNLVVVGGPNSSTQISFINGQLSRSSSLSYFLKPTGTGAAEVGETTFKLGDKDVKAGAYLFEVGPARRPPGAGPASPVDEDPFGRAMQPPGRRRVGSERSMPDEDPILAFVATPSKETCYVGEEVTVTYELVTQAEVQGIEYVDAPQFPGLWAEDLERPERPQGRRDTWEGHPVARFTLLKKSVSGLTPGTVTIPAARIRIGVRAAMDPFGDPFAMLRPRVLERETKPITLKVLAIPGRPDFKGPVGQFGVSATADRKNVPAGEAVTLKVRLSGAGNLRTATETPVLTIPNVKVYPPSSRTLPARGAGKGGTSAEWDFVLVPSVPGKLVVPPVAFEVFDTAEKRIVSRRSEPITLTVEAALPGAVPAVGPIVAVPTAANGSEASTTLPKVPPTPTAVPSARELAAQTVAVPLWALVAIPAALLLAGGAAWAVRRRRRALGAASALLVAEPGETKERAVARVERAVREHLARRTGASATAPVPDLLDDLSGRGVAPALREELRQLLAQVEFLRFAPQLGDYSDEIVRLRERTRDVLGRVRGTGGA